MSEKLFVEVLPQDEALDTVQGWEFSIGDRGAVSIVEQHSENYEYWGPGMAIEIPARVWGELMKWQAERRR